MSLLALHSADWVFCAGALRRDHAILISEEGRVLANGPLAEVVAEAPMASRFHHAGEAIVPGTVSAHSHAFQVLLRGASDHPQSFKDWVSTYLYPLVVSLDDESLRAASELCFHQMALAGITSVGEFHYVHNGPEGDFRGYEQAEIVVAAARRVGLRITLLYTLYDVSRRPGQRRMAHDPAEGVAAIRRLAARYHDDPFVTVAPAPHSLHGASRAAIEAGAAIAKELDVPWHIHLAEQEDDVPFAQDQYGATPLRVLDSWGVLDERTTLVHGIWLDEGERALLAERGAGLVTNPTTNMALGDGIAALSDLIARGVPVALGTDMNAAPNVFQELRTAEYLQRTEALRMGCIPRARSETPDPSLLFELATVSGARLLGQQVGSLCRGEWADLLFVDLSDPSLLPAAVLEGEQAGEAILNLLSSAMVPERALREVCVAGRAIVREGQVQGIDLEDLRGRLRGS